MTLAADSESRRAMSRRGITRSWVPLLVNVAVLVGFVVVAVALRGWMLQQWTFVNPDEAELMAQGRAALRSPVPYTTWTTSTTGPVWPLFLALVGALGFPLTVAFAHTLAAVLVGILGFELFVLVRRQSTPWLAALIALACWLPLELINPVGSAGDFGGLMTELLPAVLLLGAGTVPIDLLRRRPWMFVVVGVLGSLAVGAKYQAIAVAVPLVVVQLLLLERPIRALLRPALLVLAGAAFPAVVLVVAILVDPAVSDATIVQMVNFLTAYSGLTLDLRVTNSFSLLFSLPFTLAAFALTGLRATLSSKRVVVARAILVVGGIAAVFAGGMGFGHYLFFPFVALAVAAALPVLPRDERRGARRSAVLNRPQYIAATATFALVALFVLWPGLRTVQVATADDFSATLSSTSVPHNAALAAVCPPQSKVLVWGWAGELYLNNDWQNVVPFMNSLLITSNPANLDSGRQEVADAIAAHDTTCVIDAVGAPFFGVGPEGSLTVVYPTMADLLVDDYTERVGVIPCDSCTVYVRRD